MLFNSLDFSLFLPIVFVLYWFVFNKNIKLQNLLIVAASYTFYGWWDWRFLSLIFFSTVVDYLVGRGLEKYKADKTRKLLMFLSIGVNLGFLGFFKYYNFFLDNFIQAFSFFGKEIPPSNLNIILPVGISFYTFQTMSYSIDLYKRKMNATTSFLSFMAYVSFFPQLVAGPIERAVNLLPQFDKKRVYNYSQFKEGFYQMVWGLLKKIAIADSCGTYVDHIFANYESQSSIGLLCGIFFFSTQIYADFSGYSDIAIGVSKMFGFELMTNFKMPNFSRDVGEYWRRWHISLSSWFRDYLYIPLGGSKGGKWMIFRNTMIIFVVSGFWHGANWTFIVWGAFNGILFLPLILSRTNRRYLNVVAEGKFLPSIREVFEVGLTFTLISFTRIFFRSENIDIAYNYLVRMISFKSGSFYFGAIERYLFEIVPLIILFYAWEWLKREKKQVINNKYEFTFAIVFILIFGEFTARNSFIYFQF